MIAGVLLAVATVPWMQTACNLLANRFRAKYPSWEEKLTGAGHKLALLQAESRSLLQDPILLLHLFLCNVLKFTTWYIIPGSCSAILLGENTAICLFLSCNVLL